MVELLMESPTLLFGPVVGLLVVLLLLLWLMGRRRKSSEKIVETAATTDIDEANEPNISQDNAGDDSDEDLGAFTIIRREDETGEPAIDMQAGQTDGDEQSSKSDQALNVTEAAIANAERLAAIEQEMLAVRDLYRQEKIKTDVYVSETRALFDEAKRLTSE